MFRKKAAGKAGKAAARQLPSAAVKRKALAAADAALKSRAAAEAEAAAGTPAHPAASSLSSKIVKASLTSAKAVPQPLPADGLGSILEVFRSAVEPLADLDETITVENKGESSCASRASPYPSASPQTAAPSGAVARERPRGRAALTPITYQTFAASLTCEKKFYLLQERPDLVPKLSIGNAMHLDDAAGFNEIARRWDRLQFGSKATLIADKSFEDAAAHTEEVIRSYFETTYASLGEQAPSLTIHRPAFAAPFGRRRGSPVASDGADGGDAAARSSATPVEENPLILQARPAVLRYRPKDNQWVILEAQAIVDPLGTTTRAAQCLQRIHFSMMAFRYWVTQPHIPISVRKRFLSIDLDGITQENLKGHRLQDTAAVTAPIDLQRSGILHIRQFFPGPVTLMDCPPQRLVKYVQRLSLEDLLEVDRRNATKHAGSSGAFDVQNLENLHASVLQARTKLQVALQQAGRHANARSTRSLKQKDSDEHSLFECQQQLMEALLRTQTMKLVERAKDAKQRERWTTFAEATRDGHVHATYAHDEQQQRQHPQEEEEEAAGSASGRRKKGTDAKRRAAAMAAAAAEELDTPLIPIVPCFSENLGAHCSRGDVCPFFIEGKCLPQKVPEPIAEKDNHLFTLPSTAVSRKVVWWAEGMRTVRDVLHQYKQGKVKLTAPQLRYCKAVSEGEVAINPKEIDKFFGKLRYPVFIIDFEAAQFALPPFQKVVAYQSVPFQFSIDVFQENILTETPTHYDFLHFGKGYSPNGDPRPPLVDELIRVVTQEREKKRAAMEASGEMARIRQAEAEALAAAEAASARKRGRKPKKAANPAGGSDGPQHPFDGCFIAHFASFEKSCLEKLGQLEEKHRETIKNFYFLDTLDLIKKGFIHPNAGGSNSLKKVLPALCPDFQYGVFGNEAAEGGEDDDGSGAAGRGRGPRGDSASAAAAAAASSPSSLAAAAMDDVTGGDESSQKGENAMGVYRLWYHQEGGGTLQDLHRAASLPGAVAVPALKSSPQRGAGADPVHGHLSKAARDKVWSTLRIQLLEYCSLDTKALYEIMREIWKEKELVKGVPPADKTGWVFTKPTMREVSL